MQAMALRPARVLAAPLRRPFSIAALRLRSIGAAPMRSQVGGGALSGAMMQQRRAFSDEVTILVPGMGDSITEGDMGTIFFAVGDSCNIDDVLAEIETDKVTSEVKAPTSGTITAILCEEGDTVTVNQELFMLAPGEGAPAVVAAAPVPTPAPAAPAPAAAPAPVAAAAAPAAVHGGGRSPMIQFRFGHNKALAAAAAAMSSGGFSGAGLLSEFANHVDPTPVQLRAEKRKAYAWTEKEIEAFNSGGSVALA